MAGISASTSNLGGFHLEVGVHDMSVVQKGSSFSRPARIPVGIPEVSTTISSSKFSRRIRLSYPGGKRKASKESEMIRKLYKESVLSSCEVMWSWISLC
jgi:hypothetical protein